MNRSHSTVSSPKTDRLIWVAKETTLSLTALQVAPVNHFMPLQPLRQWLDRIEIRDAETAHRLCQTIPARCPFERTISLFDRPLLSIPPLCKLNPLYEEIVGLRFRALCYLADVCGEDVSRYC